MKTETGKVTLKVGEKSFEREYVDVRPESAEDILTLLSDGKARAKFMARWTSEDKEPETLKLLVSAFYYGCDLKVKAKVRGELANEAEGPDKALAQMAAQIVKSRAAVGKPISAEDALKIAKANLGIE